MFRRLKTVYFLSTKNYLLNKRLEKPLQIVRFLSPLQTANDLGNSNELFRLVKQDARPDWQEMVEKVGLEQPRCDWAIIRFCGRNRLGKQLLSFLQHLMACDRLSRPSMMVFLDVLENEKYFEPCYPLVYRLLVKCIRFDRMIAKRCARILIKSPSYYDKVVQICRENHYRLGIGKGLMSAINLSDSPELLSSVLRNSGLCTSELVNSTIELLNAEGHPDATKLIINIIHRLSTSRRAANFYEPLRTIMSLANEKDKNYSWEMKGFVSISRKCKFCNKDLHVQEMTKEEMDFLLAEFEKNVISQYLSLPSTERIWKGYIKFLNRHYYDTVVDGFNLYFLHLKQISEFWRALDFMKSRQMNPLVVSQDKLRGITDVQSPIPMYELPSEVYDDIYTVYAALRRGKGCIVVTRDNYGFCNEYLHGSQDLFQKWKETHFAKPLSNGTVSRPLGIKFGVHTERCPDPSEYKCHVVMPNSCGYYANTFCITRSKVSS